MHDAREATSRIRIPPDISDEIRFALMAILLSNLLANIQLRSTGTTEVHTRAKYRFADSKYCSPSVNALITISLALLCKNLFLDNYSLPPENDGQHILYANPRNGYTYICIKSRGFIYERKNPHANVNEQ